MNKTKTILTGFAVFASILMLSATCIAAPVQQKTSIETVESTAAGSTSVESALQQLISSIEAMALKMKNDRYLNSSLQQLSNDGELSTIANAIKNAKDFDTKVSLINSYVDVLKNKQAFISLKRYFERSYSNDIQNINIKSDRFLNILKEYQSTNTVTEGPGLHAVDDVTGLINNYYTSSGAGSGPDSASSNYVSMIGGSSLLPSDSAQAKSAGFVINTNGEIYIPDIGWVKESMDFGLGLLFLAILSIPFGLIFGLLTWGLAAFIIMFVAVPIETLLLAAGYGGWVPGLFIACYFACFIVGLGNSISWPVLCALFGPTLWILYG